MWSHAGASHTFILTLDKATVRTTTVSSPKFYLADTRGPKGRTSAWSIVWKGEENAFEIIEQPLPTTHKKDGCSACQLTTDGAKPRFTFECALVHFPPPRGIEESLEVIHKAKWRLGQTHVLEDSNPRTFMTRVREVAESVDSSVTESCSFRITLRVGETETLAKQLVESKRQTDKELVAFAEQARNFHRRRHPYDLRFLFTKTKRTLYESSAFLKESSGYWKDLLRSGFLEAEKRSVDASPAARVRPLNAEDTQIDTARPISNESESRGCNEPIHTIEVEEDDPGLFEAYLGMLQWFRGCKIKFGPVLEDSVRAMLSDPSSAAGEMAVDSDEDTEEDQEETTNRGTSSNTRDSDSSDDDDRRPLRPAAPEVMYRLADRLMIPELCELVGAVIISQINIRNAAIVLFSSLCSNFPALRAEVLDLCVKAWTAHIATSAGMIEVRKRIAQNTLDIGAVEAGIILCELNNRLLGPMPS